MREPREYEHHSTLHGFTITSEGEIPHLQYRGIQCPVKVVVIKTIMGNVIERGGHSNRPIPLKRGGRYVFALPGGGEVQV